MQEQLCFQASKWPLAPHALLHRLEHRWLQNNPQATSQSGLFLAGRSDRPDAPTTLIMTCEWREITWKRGIDYTAANKQLGQRRGKPAWERLRAEARALNSLWEAAGIHSHTHTQIRLKRQPKFSIHTFPTQTRMFIQPSWTLTRWAVNKRNCRRLDTHFSQATT